MNRNTFINKYNVVLADPPWKYVVWNKDTGQGRSAESHYKTLSIDSLCTLPVHELAADSCALFMWVTWPVLYPHRPGMLSPNDLAAAWGFRYSTAGFVWVKLTSGGKEHMGLGHSTRANTEPCLLFFKGNPPFRQDKSVRQLVLDTGQLTLPSFNPLLAPLGNHSEKPRLIYNRIEQLYEGPYLELFARSSAPGWDCWGNEAPNCIPWQREFFNVTSDGL